MIEIEYVYLKALYGCIPETVKKLINLKLVIKIELVNREHLRKNKHLIRVKKYLP